MNRGRTGGDVFGVDESSIVAISAERGGTGAGVDGGSVDHVDGISSSGSSVASGTVEIGSESDVSSSGRNCDARCDQNGIVHRYRDVSTGRGQIGIDVGITVCPVGVDLE